MLCLRVTMKCLKCQECISWVSTRLNTFQLASCDDDRKWVITWCALYIGGNKTTATCQNLKTRPRVVKGEILRNQ